MDDDPHLLLLDAFLSRPAAAESGADTLLSWPAAAAGAEGLRQRCEALRSHAVRLRLSIAVSAARFVACQGPGWMCYSSQADYAREQLGVSPARFGEFVRTGRLLLDAPPVGTALLQGRLRWSAAVELTRLASSGHARALLDLACGLPTHQVRALVDRCRAELRDEPPDEPRDDPPGEPRGQSPDAESVEAGARSGSDSKPRTGACADESEIRTGNDAAEGQSSRTVRLDPLAEARYQPFALQLPPEVALYTEETLELARAVVGFDAPVDIALAAAVAEASERIDVTVSAAEACRRFGVGVPDPAPRTAAHAMPRTAELEPPEAVLQQALRAAAQQSTRVAARAAPQVAPAASAPGSAPGSTPGCAPERTPSDQQLHTLTQARGRLSAWRLDPLHPTRRNAHRLDRWLHRQTARLQQSQAHLQDQLLQLHLDNAPARLGYPGLADMAKDLLDLSPSTTWNYIQWARRRRADHPIASARAQGRISDVQADLLEQLHSQAYLPASALPPWIDRAQHCTVRKLRDMLSWARKQAYTDLRAWANAGYPPPDDLQLQTSSRLIEDIANDPTPPDPVPLILQAAKVRTVHVRWVLEAGTLVALLQLMASIQDRITRDHERTTGELCPRPTSWWAFLAVMVLARGGWAPLAKRRSRRSHAILSRERFRCAAGGCSRRRGLEDHHLHYRGRGGSNARHNRACLCSTHHRLGEHGGILRVRGKASPDATALRWQMALDPQGRPTRILRGDEVLYDARRRGSR